MMEPPAKIQWIAFDAVGTLIFPEPSVAEVYHRIGRRHGSQLTPEEVGRRFSNAVRRAPDHKSSEESEFEFWQTLVAEVLDDTSNPHGCFTELHDWFASPSAWRCFDDVARVLGSLHRRGYKLALASNFDGRLHVVRRGLSELQVIDACIVSSEVGWRKPHAGFYRALADACGYRPEQILMVGDDWINDVDGAKRAGLQAIWLNRSAEDADRSPSNPPLSSLTALNDIVATWEKQPSQ